MSYPIRFLKSTTAPSSPSEPAEDSTVDSDFVVILAALLCALICVLGLVAVARCAWIRRFTPAGLNTSVNAPANKGLKKKVLKSLPKFNYSPELHGPKLVDCPICLTEFATGDEIRVLPQCGHGFHVTCIDTWLGSHSSCPSCRQILVVRCQKCGGVPENSSAACANVGASGSGTSEVDLEAGRERERPRQQQQQQIGCVNSFLP